MHSNFFKKITATIIITSMVGCNILFMGPTKKAEAQFAVIDVANLSVNSLQLTALGYQSGLATANNLKNFVLDGLAYMIAKQFIRQITASVVNWINSGFEGSPSFLTDPAGFFADVGDQVMGRFIASDGNLSKLCTNFGLDIRIALALKYRPYNQQRYTCTLSSIIKNVSKGGSNFTINGFTAGDFKQGNWPAFVSLTTEPQNNIYGAYLQAESDIAFQIGEKRLAAKEELAQGRGFLSFKTCTDSGSEEEYYAKLEQQNSEVGSEERYHADLNVKARQKCEIKTPGSVIENSLANTMGSGLRQLELADSINEIVNALVAQLVTQVLSAGLSGTSQRGSGGAAAYTQQLQVEQDTAQLNSIRGKMLESLNTYIARARSVKANRDTAVSVYLAARDLGLNVAKQCYVNKVAYYTANPNINRNGRTSAQLLQIAQQGITSVDNIITTQFAPNALLLQQKADSATTALGNLLRTQAAAQSARTIEDLNVVSQGFSQLVQDQIYSASQTTGASANDTSTSQYGDRLPSENDVRISQEDLATVQTQADALKFTATSQTQACQLLPQ